MFVSTLDYLLTIILEYMQEEKCSYIWSDGAITKISASQQRDHDQIDWRWDIFVFESFRMYQNLLFDNMFFLLIANKLPSIIKQEYYFPDCYLKYSESQHSLYWGCKNTFQNIIVCIKSVISFLLGDSHIIWNCSRFHLRRIYQPTQFAYSRNNFIEEFL